MDCRCNFFQCGNEVWVEGQQILNFASCSVEESRKNLGAQARIDLPLYTIAYLKGEKIVTSEELISLGKMNIKVGARIQVYAYYHDILSVKFSSNDEEAGKILVFDGFIKQILSGFPTTLVCEDRAFILRFGSVNKEWVQKEKASEGLKVCCDVANKAFKEYRSNNGLGDFEDLSVSDMTGDAEFDSKLWKGVSPYEVVYRLMSMLHLSAGIDPDGNLFLGKLADYTKRKTIKLDTKINVIDRDLMPTNVQFQNFNVVVNGWVNGKKVSAKAGIQGNGAETHKLGFSPITTKKGLQEIADAALAGMQGDYNKGTITTLLYPKVALFDYVDYNDTLFDELSGQYYVIGVKRTLNRQGYKTTIEVTNRRWEF